ncbi:MAG: TadG family pilus assembly protein [Nitrospirales bacterium]
MKHNCLTILDNQRGVGALWFVTVLGVLAGFSALVVDGGMLYLTKNELQANADIAALAAGSEDLNDEAAVKAKALEYSQKQVLLGGTSNVLNEGDVIVGNWDTDSKTWSAGGVPPNAVQVTTKRTLANGNPVNFYFAPLLGHQSGDVQATAVAFRSTAGGVGTRFLCDDEMIDKDVPGIHQLALDNGLPDAQDYMEDENPKDWFLDFPVGAILNVETGQVSDPALMDIAHEAYPFSSNSDPSHTDFLNYNTHGQLPNGGERKDLLSDGDMDPLPGVSAVTDASLYPGFINPNFVQVCPIYKSDVSVLGEPEDNIVNAKGERRGLLAFKILDTPPDPKGYLPNLRIEIVDPSTITLGDVNPPSEMEEGAGKIRIVQ